MTKLFKLAFAFLAIFLYLITFLEENLETDFFKSAQNATLTKVVSNEKFKLKSSAKNESEDEFMMRMRDRMIERKLILSRNCKKLSKFISNKKIIRL